MKSVDSKRFFKYCHKYEKYLIVDLMYYKFIRTVAWETKQQPLPMY